MTFDFSAFTNWLLTELKALLTALFTLLGDAVLWVLDGILKAILALLSLLPVPDFLASNSLSSLFGMLPSDVLYFVGHLRIGEAFAVLAAGVSFRLGRKAVTLFQW